MSHKDVCFPYSETIMQNLEGYPRIKVGGHNVHHLRYADDTVLIPENNEDLPQSLDILSRKQKEKDGIE